MLAVCAERRRPNLEDDVALRPELVGGHDARAYLDERAVEKVRAFACARFDEHVETELLEFLHAVGRGRDPLFVRRDLFGDSDLQTGRTVSELSVDERLGFRSGHRVEAERHPSQGEPLHERGRAYENVPRSKDQLFREKMHD